MASNITITLSGFDELDKRLSQEPQNQVECMIKAQNKVGAQAVMKLKQGLSHNGGRGKGAVSSPKGDMPYMHTGRLRGSIGYKMLSKKTEVTTKIGSGAMGNPIEYAKYLEGRNHDGTRPFLWAVQDLVTADRIMAYFNEYYKPLEGAK